jgi:peptide/nickel transport system permease protein
MVQDEATLGAAVAEPTFGRALADRGKMRKHRSLWGNAWSQFRKHRLAMAGLVVFLLLVLITYVGNQFYWREYNALSIPDKNIAPNSTFWLGTDNKGQDILARILWGGRISIAVGICAAFVAILIGTLIGATAGFFGGFTDSLLMRITDGFICLPQLPLLLLISFLFKDPIKDFFDDRFPAGLPGLFDDGSTLGIFVLIVIVISALAWMQTARIVRASFLSTKEKEFTEAARSIGAGRSTIMFKHILPNVFSPIIVAATLEIGAAIIAESALSFLGLGFPSDVPTWGAMLNAAQPHFQISPHQALIPGFFIFLTVLSINYIGDGLRDALDPRKTH